MFDGISFWNKESPEAFGESFMSFTLTVSPLIAKVPNLTPFRLSSFALKEGGVTFFKYENMNHEFPQRFRLDLHRLPYREGIPANLRGKWRLHYHRRPRMDKHRPFERGW